MNDNHINDELLVKYLLGEASSAEQNAVHQWINARPENEKYFNHFQLIWETSKHLVNSTNISADDAWNRFQQRTEQASKKPAIVKRISSSFRWRMAAAIVVCAIGVTVLSYFLSNQSPDPVTVSTSTMPVTDTLPDGSFVTLNKNSSIHYPRKFPGKKRNIELKGEAFFTVTPDKEKPFVISVNDVTVSVVGTSFNIRSVGGETQVIVESGIVQVTKNNRTIELHPGEKVITNAEDTVMNKQNVTDRLHEYYRSKVFVCDSTPLWKLVEVLNEAYDSNIVIARNDLHNLPLTTTFNNESLEKILSVVAQTFEISIERRGDQIILK